VLQNDRLAALINESPTTGEYCYGNNAGVARTSISAFMPGVYLYAFLQFTDQENGEQFLRVLLTRMKHDSFAGMVLRDTGYPGCDFGNDQ
jgi:hypothetical protein